MGKSLNRTEKARIKEIETELVEVLNDFIKKTSNMTVYYL